MCAQVLSAQAAPAQEENPYAVSLSYQCGFLHGQAEEVVYPDEGIKAELLSQLLWDMKSVYYNGLLLDFSQADPLRKWGFFGALSFKYGIPGNSGIMEDRDWMSTENAALTNFSSHDNTAKEIFLADFSAGLSFPLFRFLLIKPFLSVSYMRFSFSGMDGYGVYARPLGNGKYAPIDDNPDKMEFTGKVINYSQEWLYAAAGVSLMFVIHDTFSAEMSFQVSPFVSYAGLDEHLYSSKKIQYRDYTEGGLLLEPSAALFFSHARWLTFSLDCSWKHISRTRGNSFNRSYGTGVYQQQGEAGAGLSIVDMSLLVTVHLNGNGKPADPYHRLMR